MNYDLEFLEAVGIACEPRPFEDDRRARANFWRIALLVGIDVLLIALVRVATNRLR